MVKLVCKISRNSTEVVEVRPEDPLYVLLDKLNINDKNCKFLFRGVAYPIASILRFEEIGLNSDSHIVILSQALAG